MSDQIPENNQSELSTEDSIIQQIEDATGGENENQDSGDQPNINPAWKSILDEVPSEFHEVLTPKLKEWDDGVQHRFESVQQKAAPYKELMDLGVPPTDIDQALQLMNLYQTNPRAVWEYLNEQGNYGATPQVSQGQQENEAESEYDLSKEGEYDLEKDPRFQQVAGQLSQMQQLIQLQAEKEQEAAIDAQIAQEFSAVEERYKRTLTPEDKQYIAQLAVGSGNSDLSAVADVYFNKLRVQPTRASDSAPPVMSGNKGLPVQITQLGNMSEEDRTKNLMAIIAASNAD